MCFLSLLITLSSVYGENITTDDISADIQITEENHMVKNSINEKNSIASENIKTNE